MAEAGQSGLVKATEAARAMRLVRAANGIAYAHAGETQLVEPELARLVQAVPAAIAAALHDKAYYFVPLALAEPRRDGHRGSEETLISPVYSAALGDEAICHRNVPLSQLGSETNGSGVQEGVFISVRLLNDRFALAFEFFINVGHAFVDSAGVPGEFIDLIWAQAVAGTRGETSQDAWESRSAATAHLSQPDEKAKLEFAESAFSDALAIYQLSLAVDFDYSELREREYPLLAPAALAERLKLVAKLFPPNKDYEFSIRYRRRA